MRNKNSTFYLISGIIGIIFGVILCITLFGIVLGIPLIIGATKYLSWSKMSDEQVLASRDAIVIWGIVYAIFLFPLGLVALVPVFNLEGQLQKAISPSSNPTDASQNTTVANDMDAKMEKIKKLHDMKEKGIIDEEDFKLAKDKILKE